MYKQVINIPFYKTHVQGNSYVYFDYTDNDLPELDLSDLAVKVSEKNYGVGSDGIVLLVPDENADLRMRMFNADGSEAEMCGSALQSTILITAMKRKYDKTAFKVATKAGIINGELADDRETVIISFSNILKSSNFEIGSYRTIEKWKGIPVTIGNPHFVVFDCDQKENEFSLDLINRVGLSVNKHFPQGANVEMAIVNSRSKVTVRVWEIGTGETLSCGSGAMAIVLAGIGSGYLDNEVEVVFSGGSKKVFIDENNNIYDLSGKVNFICEGKYLYRG